MGGQLTVSSIEHRGSTFTFVLPYKVSTSSEHSDDPDELTDMADYDAASDDEVAESYFQFQPRTLGSLLSSNGTGRTQKLLPHKLNGLSQNSYSFPYNNIRQEEMALVENCCSAVNDVAETLSEPESSMSHIPDSSCETPACKGQDDSNSRSHNSTSDSNHRAEASRENVVAAQGTCKRQEKSDADSECSSGSSSKMPKSTSKPKILLVEDNKINVMVAQSMMKQLGQSLEVVNNGVEAVRAVQRCSYDLILMVYNFYRISKALIVGLFEHNNFSLGIHIFFLFQILQDVHMPVMDGLQATRIIRSFEETGNWNAALEAGMEQPEPSPNTLQNGHGHLPYGKRIPIIAVSISDLKCYVARLSTRFSF